MSAFTKFAQTHTQRVNDKLNDYLSLDSSLTENKSSGSRLEEAMRYSLLSGGKRIRPLLVYASAESIADTKPLTDKAAAAIECIHAYSLIHDDLPAMDDDDLRRGQATCHIQFDEATAILAGDALQAYAFELLSQPTNGADPINQLKMCRLLSKASGANGMVAGQAIDLTAINQELNLEQLSAMHNLKTGALIRASVLLGAISTGLATDDQLNALSQYAGDIGLAFQVQDDILDVISDTETLGKQQGADISHNKPTFVSLLGIDKAKQKADQLYSNALDSLSSFDYRADNLRHLAGYIVKRER
ncbi:MAG: farnesyl diphosphate synthase/geranylgeranyl diphosphate synthase type II [Cellvibrionaceae bacterium]|jgi:farnesyl diphosphate synthase/geranylgeranyl diphosphate synthase type II